MLQRIDKKWENFMTKYCEDLIASQRFSFATIKPKVVPETAGVYLITLSKGKNEIPFYVGRTQNLRQRIYKNHLMGSLSNARLKNYLINDRALKYIQFPDEAKEFI